MFDREVPEARLQDAQEVVLDWFAHENPYFEVRHLLTGLRRMMRINRLDIERDVRAARARGMVEKSWPESKVLPWPVRQKLQQVRERERAELREALLALEQRGEGDGVGEIEVGKRV